MPLPTLSAPTYELTVPSTGKTLSYRPFLVKEEKLLMIANESKEPRAVYTAIRGIVSACTFGAFNIDTATTYDVEYVFLQLRSKSVGETAELQSKCKSCGTDFKFSVNLSSIDVKFPPNPPSKVVKLTDKVGVTLRPFTFKDTERLQKISPADQLLAIVACVIESIYDENTVYNSSDVSEKEMYTFIEGLSRQQIEKIQSFVENQPTLTHTHTHKCGKCETENAIVLKGIQDFFK